MTSATNHLWRKPADPLGALRDLGTVDISTDVRVDAGRDEAQTPTITLTLSLDETSQLAALLDVGDCANCANWDYDDWRDTVTALRKALGLAGCWVELQAGP